MPFLAQVAGGHRPALTVFGNDFETRDGTGERDYIHVVDLARAHLAAIEHVRTNSDFQVFNIGTGRGVTVLKLAAAFTRMSGRAIATTVTARRSGDLARFYANAQRAEKLLAGRPRSLFLTSAQTHGGGRGRTLLDMMIDRLYSPPRAS